MNQMNAMMLARIHDLKKTEAPLVSQTVPIPTPGDQEILIQVGACGVCHTELDEIEGRTPPPRLPVIPGHQVVGRVQESGEDATQCGPGSWNAVYLKPAAIALPFWLRFV